MSKSVLTGFLFAVSVAFVSMSAVAATADDIDQLDQQWAQAIINGDMRAFDALNANEFFYNRRGGDSLSKAEYIAFLTSGDVKVKKAAREDVSIRIYGDTAVVTGIQHVDVNLKGEDRRVDIRYLHVWVNGPGGWRLVARQATNLPAPN
jgi:ketosteroid isomerase-like protein